MEDTQERIAISEEIQTQPKNSDRSEGTGTKELQKPDPNLESIKQTTVEYEEDDRPDVLKQMFPLFNPETKSTSDVKDDVTITQSIDQHSGDSPINDITEKLETLKQNVFQTTPTGSNSIESLTRIYC